MFAEQRVFRSIAFRSPESESVEQLRACFSTDSFRDGHQVIESEALSVRHVILRSPSRFTVSPLLDQVRVTNSPVIQFDYDLYLLSFTVQGGSLSMIAVPFRRMFNEILPVLTSSCATGLSFEVLQLGGAVRTIAGGKHEGGLVSVTAYEALVEGDPHVRLLQLSGSDTIHSDLYGVFDASRRFRLTPRRCTFSYDDHAGTMIQLSSDRYGNFSFRVAARARNLSALPLLFDYFARQHLTRSSWSSPLERLDPGTESDDL